MFRDNCDPYKVIYLLEFNDDRVSNRTSNTNLFRYVSIHGAGWISMPAGIFDA